MERLRDLEKKMWGEAGKIEGWKELEKQEDEVTERQGETQVAYPWGSGRQ